MTQVSQHGLGGTIVVEVVSIGEDEDGEIAVAVQWGWREKVLVLQ